MTAKKTGQVIFMKKGFGFIKQDDGAADMFFHYSDISMEGYKILRKGDSVEYEVGENNSKQPKAINIVKIG